MKTEFNVERICDRVHLCVVDAPDELGQPLIEVRNGSIYVSFPDAVDDTEEAATAPGQELEKFRQKPERTRSPPRPRANKGGK